ncbi:MAG TPA: DEAD/DEAH box helicase [Kofleriaceae bacterium]|nr:DEAD/DEAH box helicase [Kofleriaceae bacterium]
MADVLDQFHPLIAAWFRAKFGGPTAPQIDGWPKIANGDDVLIAAPTGSGKTLAAFLACLDELLKRGLATQAKHLFGVPPPDAPPNRTSILYLSPLKALSNDVQRNLESPLAELRELAPSMNVRFPDIRVGVRTGDTPAAEREKMAKHPPDILVSTPESLYIMLTTVRGRAALSEVRTVIVDEIHAVAHDKRGAHLALSLERLDRLVQQYGGTKPVRVGLSATQRPIDRIGRLLVGTRRPMPHIVDSGHRRNIDLAIEITDDELGAVASHEQFGRVYDRIAQLVTEHQSTIVFANTRRLVERVAAALEQRLGEEQVVAHHGSMSRTMRLAAEEKLKFGHVKCAVATASLELGIDVGAVDLVVQIGSPRSIATLLQRVGRSGHQLRGTPKGRMFAVTRDQLVECAALVRGVGRGTLDEIVVREAPLDILAQQIVAICASEGGAESVSVAAASDTLSNAADPEATPATPPVVGTGMSERELRELVTSASNYSALSDHQFEQVLHMLSEGVSDRRGRNGAHLHRDHTTGTLRPRRGARLAAILSGGAIPDNNNYAVVQFPEGIRVGEVDEDFAIDSSAGDVFQLGNTAWRIRRVEAGKVIVDDAEGQPPTIPFWFGEAPARTKELSQEVSGLRGWVDTLVEQGHSPEEIASIIAVPCGLSSPAAIQLAAYLCASRIALGGLPRHDLLIAERFFDEGGGMQLVIHAPLGGRINRAWGLALRKRFCRSFDFELQAAATDDGIVISLGQPHSFALDSVFQFLPSSQAETVLVQALLDQPMFEIRWRWNATRSLAVLRRRGGEKVPPHLVKMRSADLLSVVFPQAQACLENIAGDRELPDHPLVFETVRDCLVEAMDSAGLTDLMGKLERGEINILARDTVEPSPLSHELINANPYAFLDNAGLEDRRTRAVQLRRGLPASQVEQYGALDDVAITTACAEAAPTVRDADEMYDALMDLWLVSTAQAQAWHPQAEAWLHQLAAAGRAAPIVAASMSGEDAAPTVWVALQRVAPLALLFPHASLPPAPPASSAQPPLEREAVLVKIVSAQLDHGGPTTAATLAAKLGLGVDDVRGALLALEGDGAIMRGSFTRAAPAHPRQGMPVQAAAAAIDSAEQAGVVEWCNRRILARIHRLTLAKLRSEIEPVSAAVLMRFLLRWQRVSKNSQLLGNDGLLKVLQQLQGFECAAASWEREVLPARLHVYDQQWLDALCLAGHVMWCRMSPRLRSVEANEETPSSRGVQAEPAEPRSQRFAPTRSAPLTFLLRSDADWLRATSPAAERDNNDADAALSPEANAVRDVLQRRGASFLPDLVTAAKLAPDAVEEALWELVAAGIATADGFASMRVLVDRKRGNVRSHHDNARPAAETASWRSAVNKARHRDRERPSSALRSLPTAAGRWALLEPASAEHLNTEASARQLLNRYGIVFRDLLTREANLPPWRELLTALRRLEARGEIRGGRFVYGFVGEQFALPDALDELRAARTTPNLPVATRVAATDPLNLAGILSPGPKVPAVVGNAVLYVDGVAVASLEAGVVVPRPELPDGATVDGELTYQPPARATVLAPASQLSLM